MKAALQDFRAATVAPVEHSSILATSATGGVLQSTIQQIPGTASCSMAVTMSTGAATIRGMGFMFVVSGIDSR
ncbi:MAG: nicotinamide mononucleotide (NMN) deamidase PncC [Arcticibacterium sp.]|jgi:nicotinamide mononucleotide (NMN) deamidase PncC